MSDFLIIVTIITGVLFYFLIFNNNWEKILNCESYYKHRSDGFTECVCNHPLKYDNIRKAETLCDKRYQY